MKTRTAILRKKSAKLWRFHVYVTGQSAKSLTVFANLKTFCERHLAGNYRITVVDLIKQPHLAKDAQIVAIPTVVREVPKPVRTMIGNFSHTERLLDSLDLHATN